MGWFRRLRSTIIPLPTEARLDEEMRFHVDERTEELVRRGLTHEEARREAVAQDEMVVMRFPHQQRETYA